MYPAAFLIAARPFSLRHTMRRDLETTYNEAFTLEHLRYHLSINGSYYYASAHSDAHPEVTFTVYYKDYTTDDYVSNLLCWNFSAYLKDQLSRLIGQCFVHTYSQYQILSLDQNADIFAFLADENCFPCMTICVSSTDTDLEVTKAAMEEIRKN